MALIQGELHKDIAKEFHITICYVSNIVQQIKGDPDYFRKNIRKREEKEEVKQAVIRTVNLMQA